MQSLYIASTGMAAQERNADLLETLRRRLGGERAGNHALSCSPYRIS